jgi:hypothetical protein
MFLYSKWYTKNVEKSKTFPFVYQMTPNNAFETTKALNWNPSVELSNTPGMIEIHMCSYKCQKFPPAAGSVRIATVWYIKKAHRGGPKAILVYHVVYKNAR